ncbi:MAG: hypothetical protein IJ001_09350 [Oscillospiraceae bacterium]|nr:hypothetical protein [Oscillospiraceae bacterium]
MAKKNKTHKHRFLRGMVIYAVVFLLVLAVGLAVFWDFMASYERSRPQNTLDAYVEQLTAEDMVDHAAEFVFGLDNNLQSYEDICRIVGASVTELSYAKKTSESTGERQVYVLRCGSREVGQVAITAGEPDKYGVRAWAVTEEKFHFPHLVAPEMTVTIPAEFAVSVNGMPLDASYICEENIPYPALEDFSGQFAMPELVTYRVEGYLGQCDFAVTDPSGQRVTMTENMDWNEAIRICTAEEEGELAELSEEFIEKYVAFTGSKKNVQGNYSRLAKLMVTGGDLAKRLANAIDGLQYAQSNGDSVVEFQVNQCVTISEERYMCDVTYLLRTIGKKGAVDTVNNMKIVFLQTDKGLKVEAIASY